MNVLVVVTSTDRRGAEVEGAQLAEELRARGHAARCVALARGATGGLDVPVLGPRTKGVGTLRALRREARSADVVLAYGSSTLPVCAVALWRTEVPFVYRSIGDPARWVRGGWHRRRTGGLFRRAAHVVALWPDAAAAISDLYGVPAARVTCLPNARPLPEPTEPPRADARALFGVPVDATVVAWAGAWSEEKRPLAAVEAVAQLPDAWLVLAGDGPLRTEVEAAARRLLPGRHVLPGVLPGLAPLWAAADVALLTSRTEGMPGVLIEARLRGVPAVATDVGAVREVVGPRGEVVPADASPADAAAALHRALALPRSADDPDVARFTWPVVAEQWERVLAELTP